MLYVSVFFYILSIAYNQSSWSFLCESIYEPVCWEITSYCTQAWCTKRTWTYHNTCFLEQAKAVNLYQWVCDDKKTQEIKAIKNDSPNVWLDNDTVSSDIDTTIPSKVPNKVPSNEQVANMFIQVQKTVATRPTQSEKIAYLDKFLPLLKKQIVDLEVSWSASLSVYKELLLLVQQEYDMLVSVNVLPEQPVETTQDIVNTNQPNTQQNNTEVDQQRLDFANLSISFPRLRTHRIIWDTLSLVDKDIAVVAIQAKESSSTQWSVQWSINGLKPYIIEWESIAMWADKNLLITSYIQDNICIRQEWWSRTLAYQILSDTQTHTNKNSLIAMFMCQEWVMDGWKPRSIFTKTSPIRIELWSKDWVFVLLDVFVPSDTSFDMDVKTKFPLTLLPVLLWENKQLRNEIQNQLSTRNEEQLTQMLSIPAIWW